MFLHTTNTLGRSSALANTLDRIRNRTQVAQNQLDVRPGNVTKACRHLINFRHWVILIHPRGNSALRVGFRRGQLPSSGVGTLVVALKLGSHSGGR
ncbi:hypothetical protein CH275_20920 [Rhodococcus sp. 06-235-1A]|nr:hypothetical protein CH275_20920 [Rhodococcus sp. 06-235-1A]